MKRFWLDEAWHWWAGSARMGVPAVPAVPARLCLSLLLLLVVNVVPSTSMPHETCDLHELSPCSLNEVCVQVNKTTAECQCRPHFEVNQETGRCEDPKPPPEPPEDHLGLALGLGLTLLLIVVILVLVVLHRKFGLLSGMCDLFPSLRHLGVRSGDIIMVDNEDEADVNPIV